MHADLQSSGSDTLPYPFNHSVCQTLHRHHTSALAKLCSIIIMYMLCRSLRQLSSVQSSALCVVLQSRPAACDGSHIWFDRLSYNIESRVLCTFQNGVWQQSCHWQRTETKIALVLTDTSVLSTYLQEPFNCMHYHLFSCICGIQYVCMVAWMPAATWIFACRHAAVRQMTFRVGRYDRFRLKGSYVGE